MFINYNIAQTTPTGENISLDQQLSNINQSSVSSGIIYERTLQLSNLYNFNKTTTFNTATFDYFKQSLLEMNNASNGTKFITVDNLKNLISSTNSTSLDIGILNTQFNILNYDEDNPQNGGLTYNTSTNKFVQIANKVPFYMMDVTVISPLKNAIAGSSLTVKLNNNLFFTNGTKVITTLVADFGDGINRTIINNGVLINQNIIINFTNSGKKTCVFTVNYNNNTSTTTKATYSFKYVAPISQSISQSSGTSTNPCFADDPLKEDFFIVADEPFTGYKSTDPTIKARIDYRVYYANSHTDKKITKPIIIIDGFDPGDKRKFEDCDCANDLDCSTREGNLTNGIFNPNNHRSIVDVMKYHDPNTTSGVGDLLSKLRIAGFDVIIVNQPTYQTTNLQNNQLVTIDGGAYYIESNAMALVKLLQKIKTELLTNSSLNNIAVVAPSMAGQISRYALSFMEKKFAQTNNNIWLHNVYLWISVDSPHLGANIPLGDQALLNLLKSRSDGAREFYEKDLASPASRQQLIEFHNENNGNYNVAEQNTLNAQTISQGFSINRGDNFFIQHYNAQNSNGLPNSGGWPVNLRKIALVNGSLSGSKEAQDFTGIQINSFENDNSLILNLRGFARVRVNHLIGNSVFRVHTASLEVLNMPSIGTNSRISRFKRGPYDKTTQCFNSNIRGVMDNVPGGFYDAQKQILDSALKKDASEGVPSANPYITVSGEWYLHEYNPIHSFIPTFSAIAHNQPNQNWSNPLNFNLRCPSEIKTPFDSYFGLARNTQHTSFTKESVDWLLKELAGKPQAPYFPIQEGLIVGSNIVCETAAKTYTINEICKVPSSLQYNNDSGNPTNGWSVEGNLQILSFTDYSVTVKATNNASSSGKIIATFQNGQKIEKIVHIGPPSGISNETRILGAYDWVSTNYANMGLVVPTNATITSYDWEIIVDNTDFPLSCPTANPRQAKFLNPSDPATPLKTTTSTPQVQLNWGNCIGGYMLTCVAKNDCGGTVYQTRPVQVGDPRNNPCFKNAYRLIAAPNPVRVGEPIQIIVNKPMNHSPCDYYGEPGSLEELESVKNRVILYDFNGNQVFEREYYTDEFTLDYNGFRIGNYILSISTNDGRADTEIIIVE